MAAGAVLLLEILAVRLMAPYIGVSLNTYTGIIGTVLAGISAGAWVGGWAADRFDPGKLVGPLLIAGGVLALAMAPLVTSPGRGVQSDTLKAIVFLSAATVFLPAFVLSAVHPIVVKMQLQSLKVTGSVVGRLSAFATAGALVGTFGTGFFLTAHFPTRAILAGVGAVLIATGAVLWWRLARRAQLGVAIALAIADRRRRKRCGDGDGPCKVESAYACIRVVDIGGGSRKLILDAATNAVVRLDRPQELTLPYTIVLGAAVDSLGKPGEPIRALHIGGGGFMLPRYVAATRPGSANTVMEIDSAVVDTAREDLGLRNDPSLRIEEGDARLLIGDEPSASYDVVIGDAFSGFTVPWQLTTTEFFEEVQRVLKPRGVYVMNLIDTMDFVKAEAATLRDMFDDVGLFDLGGNRILVAANRPIVEPMSAQLEGGRCQPPISGNDLDRLIGGARILEDDFAPVDQLLD